MSYGELFSQMKTSFKSLLFLGELRFPGGLKQIFFTIQFLTSNSEYEELFPLSGFRHHFQISFRPIYCLLVRNSRTNNIVFPFPGISTYNSKDCCTVFLWYTCELTIPKLEIVSYGILPVRVEVRRGHALECCKLCLYGTISNNSKSKGASGVESSKRGVVILVFVQWREALSRSLRGPARTRSAKPQNSFCGIDTVTVWFCLTKSEVFSKQGQPAKFQNLNFSKFLKFLPRKTNFSRLILLLETQ